MELIQRDTFKVTGAETAPNGSCRPGALLHFLEDAAQRHATALGVGRQLLLTRRNCVWMLVRSWYRLLRPIVAGESLTVETWPCGTDGLLSNRAFSLLVGEEAVGQAAQAWVTVDIDRRQLVLARDVSEIRDLRVPERPMPIRLRKLRLPAVEDALSVTVQAADMDLNGHLNNARYMNYAMLPLPDAFVQELQINYDRECTAGDKLMLQTACGDSVRYVRGVREDGLTSFEARFTMD